MRHNLAVRALRLIAIPLLLLSISCAQSTGASPFPACTPHSLTSPGKPLPDCTFEGFNGSPTLKLSSLRGKPSVLNFWASWCIQCIGEMPSFQRVYASLGGKVSFVGMNVLDLQGETMGAGRSFAKRTGVRYQLAFDPHGLLYGHFQNPLRPAMPITVFVDARSIVKDLNIGALDESSLRQKIRTDFGIT
ncbi:MAG TPA: TlpA disulfide reductase family protein [Actinomycetota bacterium]|nr:TlpA disulfide reductase family protein [Actinomycetota bacterium]